MPDQVLYQLIFEVSADSEEEAIEKVRKQNIEPVEINDLSDEDDDA